MHKTTAALALVAGVLTWLVRRGRAVAQSDLYIHHPTNCQLSDGVALWIHGGGLVMGSAELELESSSMLAHDLGTTLVSVDYRLAPEHPYPAAIDDCAAAVRWMFDQA